MGFLLDKCKLKKMDDEILLTCHPFTCGDEDLDDFFLHDAMLIKQNCLVKLIALCWMMSLKPLFVCLLCLMIVLE